MVKTCFKIAVWTSFEKSGNQIHNALGSNNRLLKVAYSDHSNSGQSGIQMIIGYHMIVTILFRVQFLIERLVSLF
jgi:hypothetical protein